MFLSIILFTLFWFWYWDNWLLKESIISLSLWILLFNNSFSLFKFFINLLSVIYFCFWDFIFSISFLRYFSKSSFSLVKYWISDINFDFNFSYCFFILLKIFLSSLHLLISLFNSSIFCWIISFLFASNSLSL